MTYDFKEAFKTQGNPSVCVRCKLPDTAEGYYETRPLKKLKWPRVKIGICKKHKSHGGSRIFWY